MDDLQRGPAPGLEAAARRLLRRGLPRRRRDARPHRRLVQAGRGHLLQRGVGLPPADRLAGQHRRAARTWSTAAATAPRTSTPTATSTRPSPCAAGRASARSPSGATPTSPRPSTSTAGTQDGVRFLFGIDAMANLKAPGRATCPTWTTASWSARPGTRSRRCPAQARERHKERIVAERQFETLKLLGEEVAEFDYRPVACKKTYRVIVLRKKLVGGEGPVVAVRAGPVLLLHHQRPHDPGLGGRVPGQRPLRPGEPDRPAQERRQGAGDAGGQPGEQLGVHGDGEPGVEPEGVERAAAARARAGGRRSTGRRSGRCCGWSSARSAWR